MPLKNDSSGLSDAARKRVSALVSSGTPVSAAIAQAMKEDAATQHFDEGGAVAPADPNALIDQLLAQKQAAQSTVDAQSIPGTTAADSAQVFDQAGMIPGKSAAQSAEVLEGAPAVDGLPKDVAQSIVDDASVPGKTAADSAQAFEEAGAIPGKSAADSASVFEANPKDIVPTNAEAGFSTPGAAAKDGVIELGEDAVRHIPEAAEKVGLPAVAEKAALPAIAEKAGLPAVLEEIAAKGGSKALPVIGEALMMADAAHGTLGTTGPDDGKSVPGKPGYVFQGPDIVKDPNYKEPSLFDRVSDQYKAQTPALTAPDKDTDEDWDGSDAKAGGKAPVAAPVKPATAAPTSDTPSSVNPLVAKYLQDREGMRAAQAKSSQQRLIAGLARTGAMAGTAAYGATRGVDEAALKTLDDNAEIPVKNQQEIQAAGVKGIQEQQAMLAAQNEQDASDPNSATSKATRAMYTTILGKAGIATDPIQTMSANDIKAYAQNPLEFTAKMQSTEAQKQATLEMMKERLAMAQSQRDTKFSQQDEQTQAKLAKNLDATTASSRTVAGQAAMVKMKADRLQDIVLSPTATPQDLSAAAADLNSMVSGQATIQGSAHQEYNTLSTQASRAIQYVTGNPSAPDVPQIKQHIADVAKRMSKISDDVINQHTGMAQAGATGWISRHPDEWTNMLTKLAGSAPATAGSTVAAPSTGNQPTSNAPASKPPVIQNGHTYNWNPQSSKYE